MPLRGNGAVRHQGGMPVRLNLWLDDDLVEKLDAWRRAQQNPPTRAAALKALAKERLEETGAPGSPEPTSKPPPSAKTKSKE